MTDKPKKSEKRQRNHRITIRMTDDEWHYAKSRAAESASSTSAYFREKALGHKGPRSQRQPKPGREALGQISAELQSLSAAHNKIGSNINQLSRKANSEGFKTVSQTELHALTDAYTDAVSELKRMRALVLQKLGYDDY